MPLNEDVRAAEGDGAELGLLDVARFLGSRWKRLAGTAVVAGAIGYGIAWLIPPTFTARTLFVPPQQQQQSVAASALSSLGALASLTGGSVKTPADQFVSLLQSVNVEDRIIDRFDLMKLYEKKYRAQARKELEQSVRITLGKKDGLITVEVDAESPRLAADMANQYVEELRRITGELALSEAKQRRVFFEGELTRVKTSLAEAQAALQRSGIGAGALKTEPKTAAENYARIKASITLAEVRLQTMRSTLADNSSEMKQQAATLEALRLQLRQVEAASRDSETETDYVGTYREFKYQEALFETFAKQYELARMDESKEGSLIQVVDVATPPELKSKPARALIAVGAAFTALLLFSAWLVMRNLGSLTRPPSQT